MAAAAHSVPFAPNATEFIEPPTLPGWLQSQLPWRRRVARIGDHNVHFIDHQAHREHAVLLMHGNPTWSYLWRKVIHALSGQPVRIIAPDLVGLGLSSKPRSGDFHQLANHIDVQTALIRSLHVERLTIVGQDWGGPIVAGVGHNLSDQLHGMVFANTAVLPPRRFKATAFHRFSNLPWLSDAVFKGLNFPIPVLWTTQGERRSIGLRQTRGYAYPLRRIKDRAAPLALARMVPTALDHPSVETLSIVGRWLSQWRGPSALVWGTRDPILGRALKHHREVLKGAKVYETNAGHFLQEEVPEVLAQAIMEVVHTP